MNKLVAGVLLLLSPTLLPQQAPTSPPPVRLGGDVVLRSLLVRVDPEQPALA